MKFRKKPVVIEAEQFTKDYTPEGVVVNAIPIEPWKVTYTIQTLEGTMMLHYGDWVITGVRGEKYSCREDIFNETYEEVK